MGSMHSTRLRGWNLPPAIVLLVLGGLLGLSSITAVAQSTSSVPDGAERGTCARAAASSSLSIALVDAQEQVDPSEDSDQAPAGLVFPSPAPVAASTPPALGLVPLARSPFVDSTAARGPPSA